MKMKKILALIAALSMMAAVATGCGSEKEDSKASESSVSSAAEEVSDEESEELAEEDDAAEEDVEDDAADEETAAYAEALAGTLWLGMDEEYNCYAMGFNDEEIVFEANDGSSISGYWGVTAGDPTIYIFEDAELTSEIASIPWTFDTENNVMILNEKVIMAESDAYSFEDAAAALEQMATAAQVQEYLQGTYWVGISDEEAMAIALNGNEISFLNLSADGSLQEIDAYWSMDYDLLNLYDESYNLLTSFQWNMASDGSALELVNENGESLTASQVSEEDAVDIIAYLYACMNLDYEE
ncbi:hypothetical protein [Porcipelethomonas sp.]|uniref:hypothetical protein n=1 Tax=Porcipelethomonas sp. TaxID=2981675 RepID=UPI003EF73EB8